MSDTITYCIDTFQFDNISGCYTVPLPSTTTTTEPCTTGVYDELGNCAPVAVEPVVMTPYWEQEGWDGLCHEDMACWDCTTMGNLQCGPTTTAVVATAAPPPQLPATGTQEGAIAAGGSILIFLGMGLALAARRR